MRLFCFHFFKNQYIIPTRFSISQIFFVLQVPKEIPRDSEMGGTLDLSMKKSRSPEYANNHKMLSSMQLSSHPSSNSGGPNNNNNKGGPPSHVAMMPILPHQASHLYKQHPSVPSHESANNNYYHSSQVTFMTRFLRQFNHCRWHIDSSQLGSIFKGMCAMYSAY